MLLYATANFDMKNISKDILEEMQKLLLPFWNLHPLALALFPREHTSLLFHHTEYMRLLEFLYDFGGPLSPGSKLYLAVEKKFKSLAQRCLKYVDIHERFVSLHAEVPSLQQLSRTALRGSFRIGRTDTEGLDLSSLRIQWQEEMRELPRPIKDFINLSPDSIF
ncbi:hypothetical protein B566_EDAN016228 [Ephemera danica]|nr:hypothetical protein B566_EDAN016228 [Ephemera danica]